MHLTREQKRALWAVCPAALIALAAWAKSDDISALGALVIFLILAAGLKMAIDKSAIERHQLDEADKAKKKG